jgi:uncharacterized Zn finger protein
VLSIREEQGRVAAEVQGSRRTPYRVTVGLTPLSDAVWGRVFDALNRRVDLAAPLLAGEMPPAIDELFSEAKASLFPKSGKELQFSCSCPDWASVCKHVAATCYLLGEQFDEDPFLLFRLRGRDRETLLAGLQRGSGPDPAAPSNERASEPEPLPLADFWSAAAPIPAPISEASGPDLALLRRLGPFAPLDADLVAVLGPLYKEVARLAGDSLSQASGEPQE